MVTQIKLESITQYAKGINVYIDGKQQTYPVGCEKFVEICAQWNNMLEDARIMPAFGVSLHDETVVRMQRGVWVEWEFDGTYSSDGMTYEKLLVAVRPDWQAFNIVRYTAEQGYYGRCFHYSLSERNMSEFYNLLTQE